MSRNIEDLKLDEITEEFLRDECIEMGMELEVDTREGSIYRDAAEGHIKRTAKFFDDLRQVAEIISIKTCSGDVLNEKLEEKGLKRNPEAPTTAKYYASFNGATPTAGSIVSCGGYLFTVVSTEGRIIIESQDTGTKLNSIAQGTRVIPDIDVNGLISASLEEIYEPALDAESDEAARTRLLNKIRGQDENANQSQLRTWCESVEGVGRARIIPLWDGANTVKGVIVSATGEVPTADVVEAVQDYIDPGADGMGEGMAPIGQVFTAAAAQAVTVDISMDITLASGKSLQAVTDNLEAAFGEYCQSLALTDWTSDLKVRYNRISAIVTDMDGVLDHTALKVNNDTANVDILITQIPVLGEVTINESIS